MKRLILVLVIVLIAGVAVWKLFLNKPDQKPDPEKDKPLAISKNSDAFTVSFSRLMGSYYFLKDALVDWDTTKANQAALLVEQNADSLPTRDLKADSSIVLTAENLAGSIENEVKGFVAETGIDQKRRAFNMITDELYNLIRTVRYDGQPVYHLRCPMAFGEDQEGYWLSNTNKIINPYLGNKDPQYKNKMIGCGEVVDSLDFAKK
jgi:hypothetical protein